MAFLRPVITTLTLICFLAGGVLVTAPAAAAPGPTPLSDVEVEPVQATSSEVGTTAGDPCDKDNVGKTCGGAVTMKYGQGTQYRLASFSVGGETYRMLPVATGDGYTEVFRVNNPEVTGARDSIFSSRSTQGTPFNEVTSENPAQRSMGEVLSSDIITEGSDNTFANTGTLNINNVERISFMRTSPLATNDPDRVGLTVIDRGGNDPFKVAVVLSIDGQGAPKTWGALKSVDATAWNSSIADNPRLAAVASTVLRRDAGEADYRPTTITPAQRIAGLFIPLSYLGVSPATQIYGISLFPQDATSPDGPFSLTTDGTNQGGLDLVGGVFATSKVPTAADTVSTQPQGVKHMLDLVFAAGDTLSPVQSDRTVLTAPAGGTLSTDGTAVTVPGEGTYTLDRDNDRVAFQPVPAFSGVATPASFTVFDSQGASATAWLRPTVTQVAFPDDSTGPQGVRQQVDPLENDTGLSKVTLDPDTLVLVDADGKPVTSLNFGPQGAYRVVKGDLVYSPTHVFVGTAPTVSYRASDASGNNTVESVYTATVTSVTPMAAPDVSTGVQGVGQSVDPLHNDGAGNPAVPLDPDTLTLIDAANAPAPKVAIAGQGEYVIAGTRIVFTPTATFVGTATPVTYRVADANGTTVSSTYTATVARVTPVAAADASAGTQGQPQSIDPLKNDTPGDGAVPFDVRTLTLLDSSGSPVPAVTIAGQGTYSIDGGLLTFRPTPGFVGTAASVSYQVADANGTLIRSTYTATVLPGVPVALAPIESSARGKEGDPVVIDIAAHVPGLVPDSVQFVERSGGLADTLTVSGEGVWRVDPVTGRVSFTPEPGFSGNPAAVTIRGYTDQGTVVTGTVAALYSHPVDDDANPEPTPAPAPVPVEDAAVPAGSTTTSGPVASPASKPISAANTSASRRLAITGSDPWRAGLLAVVMVMGGLVALVLGRNPRANARHRA